MQNVLKELLKCQIYKLHTVGQWSETQNRPKVKVEKIRTFVAYCNYPLVEGSYSVPPLLPLMGPHIAKKNTFAVPLFDLFDTTLKRKALFWLWINSRPMQKYPYIDWKIFPYREQVRIQCRSCCDFNQKVLSSVHFVWWLIFAWFTAKNLTTVWIYSF